MQPVRLVVSASLASLVACATALGLLACSGSQDIQSGIVDGSVSPPANDGSVPTTDSSIPPGQDAGPSGDDSSTPGNDSSTPTDAAPLPDGNTVPEGGLPPTPGQVPCGKTSCAVPANQCCQAPDGGASCLAASKTCPAGTATQKCAETADCPSGDVCCGTLSGSTIVVQCAASCTGFTSKQLCRTDGECPGDNCTVQTCSFGGTSRQIEACGQPDGVFCK
jgi:hypothetical protein